MDLDSIVNRVVRDMKMAGLISDDYTEDVKIYIRAAYTAGWEERSSELTAHNKKKVYQFNSEGQQIGEYDSIAEASKKTKLGIAGLYSAVLRGTLTKKGHYWQYAEDEKRND